MADTKPRNKRTRERYSGLPKLPAGRVYSVLERVEKATGPLTVRDIMELLGVCKQSVYDAIYGGKIPLLDTGLDIVRVDPAAYAAVLRQKNPALKLVKAA